MPSREVLYQLKYCKIAADIVDIGIWFPMNAFKFAFTSDFPVSKDNLLTLGDPTFYTMEKAENLSKDGIVPTRMRGKNGMETGNFLLGGAHLSCYQYLPYYILKNIFSSECGNDIKTKFELLFNENLEKIERTDFYANYKDRLTEVEKL